MTTPAILAEVPLGRLSPGWDLWNDFQDGDRANPFKHKVMGDSPYECFIHQRYVWIRPVIGDRSHISIGASGRGDAAHRPCIG